MNQYDVAPLEGITGYVFRNVHHRHFPGVRKYYIPFIEPKPKAKKIFTGRERGDILPEHNADVPVVPQILTNKWEDFLWTAEHLKEYGYTEVNWNVGCPAKTVVSKNRGSGFLAFPEEIDAFLYQIFEKTDLKISVKTRIGKDDPEEFSVRLLSKGNRLCFLGRFARNRERTVRSRKPDKDFRESASQKQTGRVLPLTRPAAGFPRKKGMEG